MRKLVLAVAAGLLVFATAAFAASFDMDNTVLASGTGDVVSCTDEVLVSWVVGDFDGQAGEWRFDNVLVRAGGTCGGLEATVQLTGTGGTAIGSAHTRTLANDGAARFHDHHLGVSHIAPIEGISVVIQG